MQAKIVPVTALRPRLLQVVSRADRMGQEYVITKNGRPSAVIMSYDEWESWRETMDLLSRPSLLRRIRRSRTYFARGGKGKSIKDTFAE